MSGVRVKDIPSGCTEKDIKIYFSKPVNGGGRIEQIYFPLSEGHAVVIFRNSDTTEKVVLFGTHNIQGKVIRVEPILFQQVFTMLEAKFDSTVAALIQATEPIMDEMRYGKNIELLFDETRCLTGVRGNWYMLEWVWTYIEHISRQQKNARRRPKPLDHQNVWSYRELSAKKGLKDRQILEKITNLKITKGAESVNDIIILSDKTDITTLEFRYGPLNVMIYTGMITLAETDAIVNAANAYLGTYDLTDPIAYAVGKKMQQECNEYVRNFGSVPTTEVMHTSAGGEFSPKVMYIMHAVGPICTLTRPEKDAYLLTQTFLNSMKYGNHVLKINSVTMPAISSGDFGCPLETCVRSFFNAVLLFVNEHIGDSLHLRKVNLVNKDDNSTAFTVMQLRKIISQGTEKLVSQAQQQIQYAEAEDGGYTLPRVSRQKLEQDQVLKFDYIRAFGSTDEDTRRRLTSADVDMYDITLKTSNILRKYDSLPYSEKLASRFPGPVAARTLNKREKISGTSPGSNKPGLSTLRYLNEEVNHRLEGGSARASQGHQLPESQGDVPGRITH